MFVKMAIGTHKGGVGKTTSVFNLSAAYAQMGFKVLCVDCDAQGDLSWAFRKDHQELELTVANIFTEDGCFTEDLIQPTEFENISIICADRRLDNVQQTSNFADNPLVTELANALEDVREDYDVVLFDCPPGAHLSLYAAMVAADIVLCPLEPGVLSIKSVASLRADIDEIRQHWNADVEFRYFLSRAGKNKASEDAYAALCDTVGKQHVIQARLPSLTTFNNSLTTGIPVAIKSPKSKPTGYIYELATEILDGGEDSGSEEDHQAAA